MRLVHKDRRKPRARRRRPGRSAGLGRIRRVQPWPLASLPPVRPPFHWQPRSRPAENITPRPIPATPLTILLLNKT